MHNVKQLSTRFKCQYTCVEIRTTTNSMSAFLPRANQTLTHTSNKKVYGHKSGQEFTSSHDNRGVDIIDIS
jgi:hypothetical protein